MQNDVVFAKKIKDFRFGELPEEYAADVFPTCYVTTSTRPEIFRERIGPNRSVNQRGSLRIGTEYWVVMVDKMHKPSTVQSALYGLKNEVIRILENNIQLRIARGEIEDGLSATAAAELVDPQCATLAAEPIGRITRQRGKLLDGMTIIVRAINHAS